MRGRIADAQLRLHTLGDLAQRRIPRDLPVRVVDDAEPVDVHDCAGERAARALGTRDLLTQPRLEVVTRVPARHGIADARTQQPCAIDQALERRAGDRRDVAS